MTGPQSKTIPVLTIVAIIVAIWYLCVVWMLSYVDHAFGHTARFPDRYGIGRRACRGHCAQYGDG